PREDPNYAYEVGGSTPKTLFSCHLDTVHAAGGRQRPYFDESLEIIMAPKGECLGADNGAGVWLLLSMIDAKIPGFYVFHRGEERGLIGSSWLARNEPKMLKSFDRAIAFDRRDNHSVITHQRGRRCCSDVFAKALAEQLSPKHELDPTGSFTDTASYMDLISECTNVSVGYMNEHSSDEFLDCEYLVRLSEQVKKVNWEELPTRRDPSVVEYKDEDFWGDLDWMRPGGRNVMNMPDLKTHNTYQEVLDYTHDNPDIAADVLYQLLDQYGITLAEAVQEYHTSVHDRHYSLKGLYP
ncbi:MAG: hypothetical protein ACXWC5_16980, partial [Burkholderiales bacterium]